MNSSYIQLQFKPNLELVRSARCFVGDFYDRLINDPAIVSRIVLATHELLENAVKYAVDGETRLYIDVAEDDGGGRRVIIRTMNRANEQNLAVLRDAIAETASAVNPIAHYRLVMLRNARRKDGSGLGLARIRAEAEMEIALTIDGDQATLTLAAELPPRPTHAP